MNSRSSSEPTYTSFQAVRRIWPFVRKHSSGLWVGAAMVLATTGIEVAHPWVVGKAVDAASDIGSGRQLLRFSALFLVLSLLRTVLEVAQAFVIQKTGQRITHTLRTEVFNRILGFPVYRYDADASGRLLTRVTNDVRSLGEMFSSSMSVLLLDVAVILGTTVAMFALSWKIALAILLPFPLVVFSVRFFGERISAIYREVRTRLAEINGFLGENLAALLVIQRLGAESARVERFRAVSDAHFEVSMKSVRTYSMIQPVTNVLNGTTMATLLIFGGLSVLRGELTLGIVVTFLGYVRNIFQPIRDLIEKYNTFLSAGVSAERLAAIFDEEVEFSQDQRSEVASSLEVEFEEVDFTYPGRGEKALNKVSFRVPNERSLAIVGATGSGKSTIIRLLLRFYEPDSGGIRLSGSSLSHWPKKALREHIGVVHQDSYLIEGSLRENLTLGKAGISDSQLISACRTAQLWDIVVPRGGLDFKIAERGANLSAGERQLLSIARVIVFNPPILILDEATSNIDSLSEKKLLAAIQKLMKGRTSIVIAHRLSTIQQSDAVLVLEQGQVVEYGTMEALIRKEGTFARFYDLYSRNDLAGSRFAG